MKNEKNQKHRTVRTIWVFLFITFALSAICWIMMGTSDLFKSISILVMWVPGLAAFITMWIFKEKKDVLGWGIGKIGYLLLSLAIPIASGVLIYGITWLFNWGALDYNYILKNKRILIYMGSFGVIASTVMALGEEIGWRGYLVAKLVTVTSEKKTALICGIIHAIWHYPFILFLDYPGNKFGESPLMGLISISIQLLAGSFMLTWLRIKSNSVWTAGLLHGTHNIVIQEICDRITIDTGPTQFIVGEYGFGLPLWTIFLACLFYRRLK